MMGYSRGAAVSSELGAGQEGRAKATEVGGQHRRHTCRGSSYFFAKIIPFTIMLRKSNGRDVLLCANW